MGNNLFHFLRVMLQILLPPNVSVSIFIFVFAFGLQFHHRDPGLVGLLTSWKLPAGCDVFYGLIADGIHTHPATMRIAHRTSPNGKQQIKPLDVCFVFFSFSCFIFILSLNVWLYIPSFFSTTSYT